MRQVSIAVVGAPDIGKSRFIQEFVESQTGRSIPTDALMKEVHWSDGKDPYGNPDTRTIKCAKIFLRERDTDIVMYDCPGHREYRDQIKQGLEHASFVVYLQHPDPQTDIRYRRFLLKLMPPDVTWPLERRTFVLHPRSEVKDGTPMTHYNFDTDEGKQHFYAIATMLTTMAAALMQVRNPEQEMRAVLRRAGGITAIPEGTVDVRPINQKSVAFFSGGKDSVVMLHLLRMSPIWDNVEVVVGTTQYDFPELRDTWRRQESFFGKKFHYVDNSMGRTYEKDGAAAMLEAKALTNSEVLKQFGAKYMFAAYRASDEAVRSKDTTYRYMGDYIKCSPVFLFSEINIWEYIRDHKLTDLVCPLYFKGYRSLGDNPITAPCMPQLSTVQDIIDWLITHQDGTERDGRVAQDKSTPFAMEKLRDKGFF